jgi:RNA-directed DNA polymerase
MQWKNIRWKSIKPYIFKLQKKIYQASKKNLKLEMFRLQKILITSQASKLKAVKRVTQDSRGTRTAEIDGMKALPPKKRLELVNILTLSNKASN